MVEFAGAQRRRVVEEQKRGDKALQELADHAAHVHEAETEAPAETADAQ